MKIMKKCLCAVLTAVMLLSLLLTTGCSMPKLIIGGTPDTAATIADKTFSTGEYLSYLYSTFYNIYVNQGLYQYAQYGYDVWGQKMTYGEGDDAKEVSMAEYMTLMTKDSMCRQVALADMMKEHKLSWDEEKEKTAEENIKSLMTSMGSPEKYGMSEENFMKVFKDMQLTEQSVFYGLYGEGGEREVSEDDRKAYFDENYVSYKMISIGLQDSEGSDLDEAGVKKITDRLEGYLAAYKKSGNFEESVVDAYNKDNAEEGAEITPSKDEDNRQNVDAKRATDAKLMEAIRTVEVGEAKVVTYKANDTTNTAALILRLDPHDPETLFTDETENIIYGAKYEEFDKEVKEATGKLESDFNQSVLNKCDPKKFAEAE